MHVSRFSVTVIAAVIFLAGCAGGEGDPPGVVVDDDGKADMATWCGYSPPRVAREIIDNVRASSNESCAWLTPDQVVTAVNGRIGGEGTTTPERTCWLEVYANTLLAASQCAVDDEMGLQGIVSDAPLAADPDPEVRGGYYIHVGGLDGGCFSDADRGWLSPDFDLTQDDDMAALVTQVSNVVAFLRHVHVTMNGRPNPFFDTVRICALDDGLLSFADDEDFLFLDGQQLSAYVGYELDGEINTLSRDELSRLWNVSAQYSHLAEDHPLRSWWFIINPIGEAQVPLRALIRDIGFGLSDRITNAVDSGGTALDGLVSNSLDGGYDSAPGLSFEARARARLEEATPEERERVGEHWANFIESPESWSGLANAVFAEPLVRSSYDITIYQSCRFNYGNFHNINVDVHLYFSGAQDFQKYLDVHEVDQSIEVWQIGNTEDLLSFCGYTIDDVGVNVGANIVRYDGSLQTAGLELALDAVLGIDPAAGACNAALDNLCDEARGAGLFPDSHESCREGYERRINCDPDAVSSASDVATCIDSSSLDVSSDDAFLSSTLAACGNVIGLTRR